MLVPLVGLWLAAWPAPGAPLQMTTEAQISINGFDQDWTALEATAEEQTPYFTDNRYLRALVPGVPLLVNVPSADQRLIP